MTTAQYPDPLIIAPLRSHRQTFILLHGRGSSASNFGPALLSSPVSLRQGDKRSGPEWTGADTDTTSTSTLPSAFPHAKFVFPTAAKRRAAVYKRSVISQWFDNWTLDAETRPPATEYEKQEREHLPVDGLRETTAYLHELLRQEIREVGGNARNVFLGGLSQGCAAALVALLLWDGAPLGAAIGMCGWLPFEEQMEHRAREVDDAQGADDEVDGEEFNPFEGPSAGDDGLEDGSARAVTYLKDELEISSSSSVSVSPNLSFQDIPLFLGHGAEDEKVPTYLGRTATSCLRAMGMTVTWKEYPGLGHWYSESMLGDLAVFLRQNQPEEDVSQETE